MTSPVRSVLWLGLWGALLCSGPASAAAPAEGLSVCAKVGPLRSTRGAPIAFGSYLLPPLWSVYRNAQFWICTPDGRPRPGALLLEVVIEPLTSGIGAPNIVTRSVSTDEQGRFSGLYGVGRREDGLARPEGVADAELHHFRLEGETIATYVLEREARDVRFYRR